MSVAAADGVNRTGEQTLEAANSDTQKVDEDDVAECLPSCDDEENCVKEIQGNDGEEKNGIPKVTSSVKNEEDNPDRGTEPKSVEPLSSEHEETNQEGDNEELSAPDVGEHQSSDIQNQEPHGDGGEELSERDGNQREEPEQQARAEDGGNPGVAGEVEDVVEGVPKHTLAVGSDDEDSSSEGELEDCKEVGSKKEVDGHKDEVDRHKEEVERRKEEVEGSKEEVEGGKEEVEGGKEEMEGGKEEVEGGKEEVEGGKEEVEGGKEEVEGGKEEVEGGKEEVEGSKEMEGSEKEEEEEKGTAEDKVAEGDEVHEKEGEESGEESDRGGSQEGNSQEDAVRVVDENVDDWKEEEEEAEPVSKAAEKEEAPEGKQSSPMFVPTTGMFFQHDTREGAEEKEDEENNNKPTAPPSRADVADRWGHDLYVEADQGPRQEWEKKRDTRQFSDDRSYEGGRRNRPARLGSYMDKEFNRRGRREGPDRDRRPARRYRSDDYNAEEGRGDRRRGKDDYNAEEGRGDRRWGKDDYNAEEGRGDRRRGKDDRGGRRRDRSDRQRGHQDGDRRSTNQWGSGQREESGNERRREVDNKEEWIDDKTESQRPPTERKGSNRGGSGASGRDYKRSWGEGDESEEAERRGGGRRRGGDRRSWGEGDGSEEAERRGGGRRRGGDRRDDRRRRDGGEGGGWSDRRRRVVEDEDDEEVEEGVRGRGRGGASGRSFGDQRKGGGRSWNRDNREDGGEEDAATKTNRSPSFQGARGGKKSDSVPYSTGENWDDAPLPKGPTSSVTTFSLSKDRELVKMQSKSLGKARGRGHPSTQKAVPTVGKTIESPVVSGDLASKGAGAKYPAPRPGSKGIKVIEPLDKGDDEGAEEAVNQEQFEEASAVVQAQEDSVSEINDKPGLPLRGSGFSRPREGDNKVLVDPLVQDDGAEVKVESGVGGHVTNDQSEGWLDPPLEGATSQSSGQTPPTKRSSAGGGLPQQHQPQTSKPKRYSSQRQQKEKTGANVEQAQGQPSEPNKPLLATPPSDSTYNEMIAQQMKVLHFQQESMAAAAAAAASNSGGNLAGSVAQPQGMQDPPMIYPNQVAMQQFMWMLNMQREQAMQHAVPMVPTQAPPPANSQQSQPHPHQREVSPHPSFPPPHQAAPHNPQHQTTPPNLPPGAEMSLLGFPPGSMAMPAQHMQAPISMDHDMAHPHFISPGGLYFPMAPQDQFVPHLPQPPRQQPPQPQPPPSHFAGKTRSQAVPIIPPKE